MPPSQYSSQYKSRLAHIWKRHRFRIVLACLFTYFIVFVCYDTIKDARPQWNAHRHSESASTQDKSEYYRKQNGHAKGSSMYETDPGLLVDDFGQRSRDTED